jgi:apolipoprotein N-acyltransferase
MEVEFNTAQHGAGSGTRQSGIGIHGRQPAQPGVPHCLCGVDCSILRPVAGFTVQPSLRNRFLLAALAGATLAAAFPKLGVAGLGWVAPGLMLATAMGANGSAAFRIGYVAGLAHGLVSLYWLLFIPVRFAPIVGWLALSGYVALFPAAWVWLCWRLYPARLSAPGWLAMTDEFLAVSRWQRVRWAFLCAALWVAGEMVQARLFSGFPWNLLGTSQYRMLPFIQIASVTGVYGVAFLMVWFAVSLLATGAALVRQPQRRQTWAAELMVPLLCVVGMASFGLRKVLQPEAPRPELNLVLIQPSIPQTMIWNPGDKQERFRQVLALSEAALTNKPDLLVWPEAAVPSLFRWDTNLYGASTLYESVTDMARRHRVWMILGADDAVPNPRAPDGADYFNASFLINPSGEIAGVYRKRRLVIFGEYVPLARWLPFLRTFTGVSGDFTPGDRPVPFSLTDLGVKTSVLICFEDMFPHIAREHVENDTGFLLNLTNDGWFGESGEQWQHAAGAVFRAVENGLPLVRCANNGLTCWMDPQGRMNEVFFPGSPDVYRAGFKVARVPIGQWRSATFYRRYGDVFGWACVGFAALAAGWEAIRRRASNYR